MPSAAKLLAGASGVPTDPNFRNVTLLLHGDGSNGAQNNTFIDSSTNNFTITRNGNTTQGSFSPYGSRWSNYFDGNGDYLTIPSNTALAFGTGDFTTEAWVYKSASGSTVVLDYASAGGFGFLVNDTQIVAYQSTGAAFTFTYTLQLNSWAHIALVRASGVLYCYVNGTLISSLTCTTNFTSPSDLNIGRNAGGNFWFWNGYISDLRIVKGTAVYTSAFTPPIAPLTAITNTSLLTCQSNRFRDASTNNFAITRNGDVAVSPFSPYAPTAPYSTATNGGSMYFDGTSTDSALTIGTPIPATSDFTIQFWYYLDSTSVAAGTATIVPLFNNFNWYNQSDLGIFIVYNLGTNSIEATVATGGGASITPPKTDLTAAANCVGRWTHIALVRSGATVSLFVNGAISSGTLSSNTGLNVSTRPFNVGGWYAFQSNSPTTTRYAKGYISNLKIDTAALYTAAFTPPSSPQTAGANTSRLLNGTNAGIVDSSADVDLETVGNAQISTSVKKFGTGSIYFDGTGDWLTIPGGNQFAFGTGDFTIECWINKPAAGNGPIIDARGSAAAAPYALYVDGSNYPYFYDGTSYTSSVAITNNQWNHVAVTRSSGTLRIFVNGTQGYSGTVTTNMTAGSTIFIGGQNFSSPATMTGYIDDLRITKGVARYTANFTPPTAAFPDQ